MPKGKYKKYYGINCTHQIPRSTLHYWKKQNNNQQPNHIPVSFTEKFNLNEGEIIKNIHPEAVESTVAAIEHQETSHENSIHNLGIINNQECHGDDNMDFNYDNNFDVSSNDNDSEDNLGNNLTSSYEDDSNNSSISNIGNNSKNNKIVMCHQQEYVYNDINEELSHNEEEGIRGHSIHNSGIIDDDEENHSDDNMDNFEFSNDDDNVNDLENENSHQNDSINDTDTDSIDSDDNLTVSIHSNNDRENFGNVENMLVTNQNKHDHHFSQKLCNCTDTTRGDLLSMVMCIAIQDSLTWTSTMNLLLIANNIFNTDIISAQNHKLFHEYFPIGNDSFTYHIYCYTCEIYIGIRTTSQCNTRNITCDNCYTIINTRDNRCLFITLNIEKQLEELLKNEDIQSHIFYQVDRRKQNIDAMEDVYDGHVYQVFETIYNSEEKKTNLSFIFNTDGCQSASSSKVSIWPIYMMLNELSLKSRRKYIILAGLWVQPKQPPMNIFLQPFINEVNDLATNGITWIYKGEEINSKVFALGYCVDSCARYFILNMKKFNGTYGCTFCEHPTEDVNGFRKFTMSLEVPSERTDSSIRRNMYDSYESSNLYQSIFGVHGPSVLINLHGFDLRKGMIVDYMHSVLLGVAKQYTEIILASTGEEYYLGDPNNLTAINRLLKSIRVPNIITRTPRSLCNRKLWKASEYRSWLIFYSLPCLYGKLPRKYLYHFATLVAAVEILLRDFITQSMLRTAERLFIRFVVYCQIYFSKGVMTYNIHLLLHLVQDVKNWGPLSNHNAFCFENENRLLLNLKTSPFEIATQIAGRYMRFKLLPDFISRYAKSNRFKEFQEELLNDHVKKFIRTDDCILIGSGVKYTLSRIESELIGLSGKCLQYKKFIYYSIRYTSELYKRPKKTNDSVIITNDGKRGIITNICTNSEEDTSNIFDIFIFFRLIRIDSNPFLSNSFVDITHIKRCFVGSNNDLQMCKPSQLKGQCILMQFQNTNYVSDVSRGCYGD